MSSNGRTDVFGASYRSSSLCKAANFKMKEILELTVIFRLTWWEEFAKLYDTYGLPVDLIYVNLRDTGNLPEGMTSEYFENGMKEAVKILQVGGWEKMQKHLLKSYAPVPELASNQ